MVMYTIGNDVLFQANEFQVRLSSGDACVMDAVNVFHGVVVIFTPKNGDSHDPPLKMGLPIPGSRLGVLLWQSSPEKMRADSMPNADGLCMENGFDLLFGDD